MNTSATTQTPARSTTSRPRVAVLFGGRSGEHAISCATAAGVLGAIDRSVYDVVAVGITRDGQWLQVDDDPNRWRIVEGRLPEVTVDSALRIDGHAAHVLPGLQVGDARLHPLTAGSAAVPLDVVFPVLHGPYGEDGTVQGLLDLAGIRYVGSGVLASAVGMDKHVMKTLLRAAGLPVADWVSVSIDQWRGDRVGVSHQVARLGWPVFVKPARAGSSLGVSRVKDDAGLDAAIAAAAEHDPRLVIEAAVTGREIECGVLGGLDGSPAEASECGEIVMLGGREFYDFEAKYLDPSAARLDCPADLPPGVAARVATVALAAFEALRCEGLARVDVFVDGRQVVVNEVNTMPGFTPISMYPRMWQATGLDYPALVDRLLRIALARPVGLR